MDLTIPIPSESPYRFVVYFNYQYGFLSNQICQKYFYCKRLVYDNFEPYYYEGYEVMLYKVDLEDSIDSEGSVIFRAIDGSVIAVHCKDIVQRFHNFKIIYPKSALGDYWRIKSNYEIADYDDSHYIPIRKKV